MKLNIIASEVEIREGYIHFPIIATLFPDTIESVDRLPIPGTVDELVGIGFLDYLPPEHLSSWLDTVVNLVAVGGTITLGRIDLIDVAHYLANRLITPEQAHILLHGKPRTKAGYDPHHPSLRLSNSYLQELVYELEARGLTVIRRAHHFNRCVVTAEKK